MKNRLIATILACGLAVSMLSCLPSFAQDSTEALEAVYDEAATEAAEAASEAEEIAAEAESSVEEALTEAAGVPEEAATEAAEPETAVPASADAESGGPNAALYESLRDIAVRVMKTLSSYSEAEVQKVIDESTNESEVRMAANWQSVAKELGNLTECGEQTITDDGSQITVVTPAVYDGVPAGTNVNVTYVYNVTKKTASMTWDVIYPKSKLFKEAGLNTLMGVGIVFCTLVFLSFIISQLHWIPDLVNGRAAKKEPAKASPAAPAAAPAPVIAEPEELTDDLELVAVIAAAIAASEEVPADGFVVRSIRRINRKKRQGA